VRWVTDRPTIHDPSWLVSRISTRKARSGRPGSSVKAAAKAFERAGRADLQESLVVLVEFVLVVAFVLGRERRWCASGRVAA
jgi:hypothetical protein